MDDYIFQDTLRASKSVKEDTSCVEILNFRDPTQSVCEELPLHHDNFEQFLQGQGRRGTRNRSELTAGLRMIVQKDAKHPETFSPGYISLPRDKYESMIEAFRLPTQAIETTTSVSALFWCAYNHDKDDPRLVIIFRKADVRKKGKTRGWEMLLSYSFEDRITTGFVKGTPSSRLEDVLKQLAGCAAQIGHPLLLPMIMLVQIIGHKLEQTQRGARQWLTKLEDATAMSYEADPTYLQKDVLDLDLVGRDLAEAYSQTLWTSPAAYLDIIDDFRNAMQTFWDRTIPEQRTSQLEQVHQDFLTRLDFHAKRLRGVKHYSLTTQNRLAIQQFSFNTVISERDNAVNLESNREQRRLAYLSTRDSDSMKALSLVGIMFLPGTFLASLFSMSFFDFKDANDSSPVSGNLWIYFAVTVPITAMLVVGWLFWERRRQHHAKFHQAEFQNDELNNGVEEMEREILAVMRRRILSKPAPPSRAQNDQGGP